MTFEDNLDMPPGRQDVLAEMSSLARMVLHRAQYDGTTMHYAEIGEAFWSIVESSTIRNFTAQTYDEMCDELHRRGSNRD